MLSGNRREQFVISNLHEFIKIQSCNVPQTNKKTHERCCIYYTNNTDLQSCLAEIEENKFGTNDKKTLSDGVYL